MPLADDLDPTERFTDRVADYVKYRPSYPAKARDAIVAGLGRPSTLVAADIGAGTGISARWLADSGMRVVAVEPNLSMRSAAEPHARVAWRHGTAESTGLPDASVDLLLSAQAFHWFRAEEALREFARILRRRARLALIWNQRNRADPFTAAYRRVLVEADAEGLAEQKSFDPEIILRAGVFTAPRLLEFANQQVLDGEGLIRRAMSGSHVPKTGPTAQQIIERLADLHGRHADAAGCVTLVYTTLVYLSERE